MPTRVALVLLAVLAFPLPAAANALDLFGFGPRAASLASACTAHCADVAANYYNPGALAAVEQVELTLGYAVALPRLDLDGRRQAVDESRGVIGGVVVPGELLGVRFAFGTGVHLPDGRLTRVRALPPGRPRFVLFDNKPQRLFVSSNLAVELLPGLSVGGGLTYMAETVGTVLLSGEVAVPDEAGDRTALVTAVDVDLRAVRYPAAGVRWEAMPGLVLGASWRGEFSLALDLTTAVEGDLLLVAGDSEVLLLEGGEFDLRSRTAVLFSPMQMTVGVAWVPRAGWTVVADLLWSHWSGFPSPVARIEPRLDLSPLLEDATSRFPPPTEPVPAGFSDTWTPRLGLERTLGLGGGHALAVRAGYAFEPTPAPVPRGTTNLVDSDRHVASAGLGLELEGPLGPVPGPVVVEVHAAVMRLTRLEVPQADPAEPAGDFTAEGWVWTGGGWVRARF